MKYPHKKQVAGKSRLKLHLKPLKMTGMIDKIERVDTFGRKVTQESNRESAWLGKWMGYIQPIAGMVIGIKLFNQLKLVHIGVIKLFEVVNIILK